VRNPKLLLYSIRSEQAWTNTEPYEQYTGIGLPGIWLSVAENCNNSHTPTFTN